MTLMPPWRMAAAATLVLLLAPPLAGAQAPTPASPTTPGTAPATTPAAKTKPSAKTAPAPAATDQAVPPQAPAVEDYREEMRRFVQLISTFAHRKQPDFVVVAENALELLTKVDPVDDTRKSPAQTYIRSIDGVLQDALFFGAPKFGKPTPDERRHALLSLTDLAKANGLKVLVVDYVKDRKGIQESFRSNAAKGYASFAAPGRGMELNHLPAYADWPYAENPTNVLSLKDVRNFVVLRNSAALGRQDEFAMKMHGTNFDMVIVDPFHGRRPLSKRAVATLKYKKLGARRLVLAHINIGTAASYLYYWKPKWREGSPVWISAPIRNNPDQYYVEYWRPEWQKIITGDTKSYVYGIIDLGFDGIVLGGLDSYRFFETGEELNLGQASGPAK